MDSSSSSQAVPAPAEPNLIWERRPFEHRFRVLVHTLTGARIPGADATVKAILRLIDIKGTIVHSAVSAPVNVPAAATSDEVIIGKDAELSLSMLGPGTNLQDYAIGLVLEMVISPPSADSGIATRTINILELRWPLVAVPYFYPVHLHARGSTGFGQAPAQGRKPAVTFTMVREADQQASDLLGDKRSVGLEMRVHNISPSRSLPIEAENALVALCVEPFGVTSENALSEIPIRTFFYDQRQDLGSFLQMQLRVQSAGPSFFLTPMASGASSSPDWKQHTLRALVPPFLLANLTVLLYERSAIRQDLQGSSLGFKLLGFATLNASGLISPQPRQASDQKSPLPIKLLENPTSSPTLEVEARVWQRTNMLAVTSPQLPRLPQTQRPALQQRAPVSGLGTNVAAALGQEAQDFRSTHELTVQLAKEFNLRAAALKRAGEEIVELRRQVQMLTKENARLKADMEHEEQLNLSAEHAAMPEGLAELSSVELAQKLQKALTKYREEKARGAELTMRLGDAMKEAAKARDLQRVLEEIEHIHLEQNRELQRLQDEGRKLETYRQTVQSQEKVIAKLEKILEGSLNEVQKAQRVQADIERLKTENAKLRDRCAALLAFKRHDPAARDELQKKLAERQYEADELERVVKDLKGSPMLPGFGASTPRPSAAWMLR